MEIRLAYTFYDIFDEKFEMLLSEPILSCFDIHKINVDNEVVCAINMIPGGNKITNTSLTAIIVIDINNKEIANEGTHIQFIKSTFMMMKYLLKGHHRL